MYNQFQAWIGEFCPLNSNLDESVHNNNIDIVIKTKEMKINKYDYALLWK
jgi:hypothetical protein